MYNKIERYISKFIPFSDFKQFLAFARRGDIRIISFDTDEHLDMTVPLKGVKDAVALDWDSSHDSIYWSDVTQNIISRARWDGKGQEVKIETLLFWIMLIFKRNKSYI